MSNAFRFRTRSGRVLLLVPESAVSFVRDARDHELSRQLMDDPMAFAALHDAAFDLWWGADQVVAIELGPEPLPGHGVWAADGDVFVPTDDIHGPEDRRNPNDDLGWFSLELVDHAGIPFAEQDVTLVHCDGRRDRVVLDRNGRWYDSRVPRPGPTRVELPRLLELREKPQSAPPAGPLVARSEDVTIAARDPKPLRLAIDRAHRLIVADPRWIAIRCVGTWGALYPAAPVFLRTPSGELIERTLDGDSRLRVDNIVPPGSCEFAMGSDAQRRGVLPVAERTAASEGTPMLVPGGPGLWLRSGEEHVVLVKEPHGFSW